MSKTKTVFDIHRETKYKEIKKNFDALLKENKIDHKISDSFKPDPSDIFEIYSIICLIDCDIKDAIINYWTNDGFHKNSISGIDSVFIKNSSLHFVQNKLSKPKNSTVVSNSLVESANKFVDEVQKTKTKKELMKKFPFLSIKLLLRIQKSDFNTKTFIISICENFKGATYYISQEKVSVIGLSSLFKTIFSSRVYPKPNRKNKFTITFKDKAFFNTKTEMDKVKIGLVNLKEVSNLLTQYKEKNNTGFFAIFSDNVRYGFNKSNPIANAIKNTSVNDPEHFVFLNNGITILVDDLKNLTTNVTNFKNPRIINGQQTAINIMDTNTNKEGFVLVKIMELSSLNHSKVANSSNAQIPVKYQDLISNLSFQKDFFEFFISREIQYKVKKGTKKNVWRDLPKVNEFKLQLTSKKLFQTLIPYYDHLIDGVSSGTLEKFFEQVYKSFVFDPDSVAEESDIPNTVFELKNIKNGLAKKIVVYIQLFLREPKIKTMIDETLFSIGYEQIVILISKKYKNLCEKNKLKLILNDDELFQEFKKNVSLIRFEAERKAKLKLKEKQKAFTDDEFTKQIKQILRKEVLV